MEPMSFGVLCQSLPGTDPLAPSYVLAQRLRRQHAGSLLTSAGVKNASIHDALVELLGKPIAESNALCIPTAIYAFPGGAGMARWKLISGRAASPLCELGWKSLGVLELTALPSIERAHWTTALRETDALLVGGGDPLYLCYWMRQSGLSGPLSVTA